MLHAASPRLQLFQLAVILRARCADGGDVRAASAVVPCPVRALANCQPACENACRAPGSAATICV